MSTEPVELLTEEESSDELDRLRKENFRLTALLQESNKEVPPVCFPSNPDLILYNINTLELTIVINGKSHKINNISKSQYMGYLEFLEKLKSIYPIKE